MNRILPIVLLVAAAVVTAIVLSRRGEPLTPPDRRSDAPPASARAEPAEVLAADRPAPARAAVDDGGPATDERAPTGELGTLIVRAVWGEDGEPAAGVHVDVRLPGGDDDFDTRTIVTGADGVARFPDLPPRRALVTADRGGLDAFARAEVVAGREVDVELRLEGGVDVSGRVVDADAVPVAGADVVVAPWAGGEARALARTDAEGRFALRALGAHCHVGARAVGHAPSMLQLVSGGDGARVEIRIVLPARGGALAGVVRGPDGEPVEGALVQVGGTDRGHIENFADGSRGKAAMPANVRTDADGRFAVDGIAAGETAVIVRARGLAPWQGATEVRVAERAELIVQLEAGAVLIGRVRDDRDEPVAGARIVVGSYADPGHRTTTSDAEGRFRIAGLGAGELELAAISEEHGRTSAKRTAIAGRTVEWDAVLSRGLVLRGRVVDDDGKPVERAILEARQPAPIGGSLWFRGATTDAEGRFELTGCSPGVGITIQVRVHSMFPQLEVEELLPGPAEVVIRVPRVEPGWITGRVVGPDGEPAENVAVSPALRGHGSSPVLTTDAGTGAFRLGPYPPGEYRVGIDAAGLPSVRTPWRALGAGETVDLGTIRLQEGGALEVALAAPDGGELPRVSLTVLDGAGEYVTRAEVTDGAARSELLPPGSYVLQIRGAAVASTALPFTIRPGAGAALEFTVEAGVPVDLTIAAPPSVRRVQIEVFDAGGHPVLRTSAWRRREGGMKAGFGLRAGPYRIVATTEDGLRGEHALEVAPGPTVEITLPLR